MGSQILFVSPNSYVVRNWLVSGLASLCEKELGLFPVFASPFEEQEFQSPDGRRFKNFCVQLDPQNGLKGFVWSRIGRIWGYTYALEVENSSRQFMKMAREKNKYAYAAAAVKTLLPRGSWQRRLGESLVDCFYPRYPRVGQILSDSDCEVLITGSPGFSLLDQMFMKEAESLGIPTHCVVNSWDNLTTRGPMFCRPKTLMVWNEFMKEQAVKIHEYPASQIFVVGPLQFMPYTSKVTEEEANQVYRTLGLPPRTPYFLYMTGQHFAEYEAEDMTHLGKALRGSKYGEIPIVLRLHPEAKGGPFEELSGPNVILNHAPRFSNGKRGATQFGLSEIRFMAALLKQAKVVFSSWGTTALLEACVFDRPIVQLRWMKSFSRKDPDQAAWVGELQKYQHLKPFDATGCRYFCDEPQSLESAIDLVLAQDEDFRWKRRRAVEQLASSPLDKAPRRVLDVLKTYVG